MHKVYFISISILCMVYVILEVRKKRFSIKESFWWMIASLVMLFLSIFPYSIDYIAKIVGIDYPPSLLFVFCIIFLIFINFRNSKKISEQQEKIIDMAQHISIIKSDINNIKKKQN